MPLATPMELEELVDKSSGKEIVDPPQLVGPFEKLTKRYENHLNLKDQESFGTMRDVLTPLEINTFLQTTIHYEQHHNYSDATGFFISRLIHNSYNAGHTNFQLDLTSFKPIHRVGYTIKSDLKNPCIIHVAGTVGSNFGAHSENTVFTAAGAGNFCGYNCKNSVFTIGTAGDFLAVDSTDSIFTITKGPLLYGFNNKQCTFKTTDVVQLKRFEKYYYFNEQGHRLFFIHPDGSEEEVSL